MKFHVLTLFPEMFTGVLYDSMLGRAEKNGIIKFNIINIRDFACNKHNRVDDYPYGGGRGMVMQAEPIYKAYQSICNELDEKPLTDMVGYGTYPYPEGCWSDDTSMSLATLDSLASGKLDFDDIMAKFGKWYYDNEYTPTGEMFDVGNTCRYAIENYFAHHKTVEQCGLTDEHSNGNGSLMRILPMA